MQNKKLFIKVCRVCNQSFETFSNVAKTCLECKDNKYKIQCKGCNKTFKRNTVSNYCSDCHSNDHLCACGCQGIVSGIKYCGQNIRYIKGHARKNKHTSLKHKKKISEAHKGRKLSDATKKKISESNKGKKLSEATKQKMSIIAKEKGFGKWMKGRKCSENVKRKLSEAHKGHPCTESIKAKISVKNKGENNGMFGKTHSKEYKKILSKNFGERWRNPLTRTKLLARYKNNCSKNSLYTMYKNSVKRFTRLSQKSLKESILIGRAGSPNALQIDHRFSKKQGFLQNIAPWVIGHRCNLELLPWKVNVSKQDKCSITLQELIKKIRKED